MCNKSWATHCWFYNAAVCVPYGAACSHASGGAHDLPCRCRTLPLSVIVAGCVNLRTSMTLPARAGPLQHKPTSLVPRPMQVACTPHTPSRRDASGIRWVAQFTDTRARTHTHTHAHTCAHAPERAPTHARAHTRNCVVGGHTEPALCFAGAATQ